MSFENLKEAILAEAQGRVAQIEQEYGAKLAREETRIKQRAREQEEQIIRQAEARGEQERSRLHQERQLAAKARVLEAKQDELAKAQAAVTDRILQWEGAQQKELLTSLLALLPKEKGTITPGAQHKEALVKLVHSTKLSLDDTSLEGEGGFIYRTADTEINLTIAHLVERLFVTHRAELARHLFS